MFNDTVKNIISQLFMKEVLLRILKLYQNLKNVFNLVKVKKLSFYCSYDHHIKIDENKKKLLKSRVYLIFNYKLKKLKKYLNENLKKSFISFSHASYASSMLFAVKLNESLQMCVNY